MSEQLPLSTAIAACGEQITRYLRRELFDDCPCLELFRRAIKHNDNDAEVQEAWEGVVTVILRPIFFPQLRREFADEAEDVFQQALTNFYQAVSTREAKLHEGEGDGFALDSLRAVHGYFRRCLLTARDAARDDRKRLQAWTQLLDSVASAGGAESITTKVTVSELWKFIDAQLPLLQQAIFHLRFEYDRTPKEIASLFGLEVAEVYVLIAQSKRQLYRALQQEVAREVGESSKPRMSNGAVSQRLPPRAEITYLVQLLKYLDNVCDPSERRRIESSPELRQLVAGLLAINVTSNQYVELPVNERIALFLRREHHRLPHDFAYLLNTSVDYVYVLLATALWRLNGLSGL